ncbi:MAG TPA: MFS transporter [Acetobacteraceae bacterium]|jgi:sugar phosphate permease|nr:MFS transporter [Acetobacteraceae bacterium]
MLHHLAHPTRSRWMRILGVAFVMYVLSYIDRTNIAMAIPAMREEMGLSAASIGFATSTFFWGYIVLQIPAGRLAGVWSAKRVIAGLLVLWSIVSLTTALVHTEAELIANRFALGIAEGGVLTCTLVLIRAWFSRAERARANTMFLLSLAVAPVIANPVSGLILSVSSWRTMFVLEALPAVLWGFVWWWAVDDDPRQVDWLDPAEHADLLRRLAEDDQQTAPVHGHWLRTLLHPAVLLLALYNFLALMAEWGVNFWLPTVLKETGRPIMTVGFLAALPYAVGIVMMVLVARSSDRRHERKWHMIAATAASGVCLLLAQLAGVHGTLGIVLFLTLAIGCFLGRFGPFWTLPTEVLPPAVAGVGIGLINGAGNLGGTVGPYFFGYVRTVTGSFTLALTIGGLSLILGSLVAIPIRGRARGSRYTAPAYGEGG